MPKFKSKNEKISESMTGNTNAEKWTEAESIAFMNKAYEMSLDREYDFIGEITRELKTYKEIFSYLSEKFPSVQLIHNQILSNLEANCFYNSKKGKIKEATAIVNLKSNYGWTDRQQMTVSGVTLHFDKDDEKA